MPSTVARTCWPANSLVAASAPRFKSDYEEERILYSIMHAHAHAKFDTAKYWQVFRNFDDLTRHNLESGKLSDESLTS